MNKKYYEIDKELGTNSTLVNIIYKIDKNECNNYDIDINNLLDKAENVNKLIDKYIDNTINGIVSTLINKIIKNNKISDNLVKQDSYVYSGVVDGYTLFYKENFIKIFKDNHPCPLEININGDDNNMDIMLRIKFNMYISGLELIILDKCFLPFDENSYKIEDYDKLELNVYKN